MVLEPGKNDLFLRLFMRHQRRIYSFILMLVPNRNDAEDIMQETLSVMWRRFDEFEEGTNFGAWAVRIAHYKILKLNAKKHNQKLKFSDAVANSLVQRYQVKSDQMELHLTALQDCLRKLSKRNYELVLMRYEQDITIKKMAEIVEMPVAGLYKLLSRVHEKLLVCVKRQVALEERL